MKSNFHSDNHKNTKFISGFIGFLGLPNAGKSSLINAIVGEKVGIVTSKPQTTRQKVIGIYSDHESQILCVDTPGFTKSESGINGFLKEELKSVIRDSEALVAVFNPDAKSEEDLEKIVNLVKDSQKPWLAVISKSDLPQKHRIALIRKRLQVLGVPIIATSAKQWPEDLKETFLPSLKSLLPFGPPLYEGDIYTTQRIRDLSSEIIREKCFEFLHQEIPYGMAVRVAEFKETSAKKIYLLAELIVNKDNHRPIIIGENGKSLKKIGRSARLEIEALVDKDVFLDLHVKVKPHWMKEKKILRELGYVVGQ